MSETSHHHESRFDLRGTAEKNVTNIYRSESAR